MDRMKTTTALGCVGLLAMIAACGKGGDAGPAAGSAAPRVDPMAGAPIHLPTLKEPKGPMGTPHPQTKLTVTLDGKPVAMATALAWRDWNGGFRVTASSVPVSCADVTGDMRSLGETEVTFDVQGGRTLLPDGKEAVQVRSTYFGGSTHQETMPATGSGDGAADQPTTLDVDFAAEDTKGRKLAVKGTLDALGCAAPTHGTPPPMPPPMSATMTIAGVKLPIRGAFLSKIGDWPELKLTTGAETCKSVPYATPGDFEMTLTWFKPAPAVGQIQLGGVRLGQVSADQTFDKAKLVVTPGPAVTGEVTLAGEVKVAGYAVKLEGKVTAVECPK